MPSNQAQGFGGAERGPARLHEPHLLFARLRLLSIRSQKAKMWSIPNRPLSIVTGEMVRCVESSACFKFGHLIEPWPRNGVDLNGLPLFYYSREWLANTAELYHWAQLLVCISVEVSLIAKWEVRVVNSAGLAWSCSFHHIGMLTQTQPRWSPTQHHENIAKL